MLSLLVAHWDFAILAAVFALFFPAFRSGSMSLVGVALEWFKRPKTVSVTNPDAADESQTAYTAARTLIEFHRRRGCSAGEAAAVKAGQCIFEAVEPEVSDA